MADQLSDLDDSILAKIQGVSGITAANVQFGESRDLDNLTRTPSKFPRVEFFPSKGQGLNYFSQTDIEGVEVYQFYIHTIANTEMRDNGTDLKALRAVESKVRAALYEFNKDNPAPTTGFLLTEANYEKEFFYELFNKNLNTADLIIGFRLESDATTV